MPCDFCQVSGTVRAKIGGRCPVSLLLSFLQGILYSPQTFVNHLQGGLWHYQETLRATKGQDSRLT